MKNKIVAVMVLSLVLCSITGCTINIDRGEISADSSDETTVKTPIIIGEDSEEDHKTDDTDTKTDASTKKEEDSEDYDEELPNYSYEAKDTGYRFTFTADGLDGISYNETLFADYDLVLLNMWEAWCEPCVEEMRDLEALSQTFKDKKLLVVGVTNYQQSPGYEASHAITEAGVTYLNLQYNDDFKPFVEDGSVPCSLFLDSEGRILPFSVDEILYMETGDGIDEVEDQELISDIRTIIGPSGEVNCALSYDEWVQAVECRLDYINKLRSEKESTGEQK